jgi:hypothetical protein
MFLTSRPCCKRLGAGSAYGNLVVRTISPHIQFEIPYEVKI